MRTRRTTLRTRFAPATHYNVVPAPVVPFRAARDTELELLKQRLLRDALTEATDADLYAPLRRAANEATATAWLTPFPLLFLPLLFEEKASAARAQLARQRNVRSRSRRLLQNVT